MVIFLVKIRRREKIRPNHHRPSLSNCTTNKLEESNDAIQYYVVGASGLQKITYLFAATVSMFECLNARSSGRRMTHRRAIRGKCSHAQSVMAITDDLFDSNVTCSVK